MSNSRRSGCCAGRRGALVSIVLALLVTACSGKAAPPAGNQAFKIGVLAPITGPQAVLGEVLKNGVSLYFQQNPEIAGRRIEFVIEDDASNPQQGLRAARKLVEQDHVNMLFGVINSAVLAAVEKYAADQHVPFMSTNASTMDFTAPPGNPYRIRVSHANSTVNLACAWYAYDKLGYRRMATVTWDFIAGTEMQGFFKKVFTQLGGKIVQEQFGPLGTKDWGPYISKIPHDVDAVYVMLAGPDAVSFWKNADSFGLLKRTPLLPMVNALTDIWPIDPKLAAGQAGCQTYFHTIDTPVNKAFVDAYRAAYGKVPFQPEAVLAYTGALVVAKGLEAVKGDTSSDPIRFVKAMREVRMTGPSGPVRFDQYGQAIIDVYVAKMEQVGGNYEPVVIDTIPDVDQFWTPPTG